MSQTLYQLRNCSCCGQPVSTTKEEPVCTVCGGTDKSLLYLNKLDGGGATTYWSGCNYWRGQGKVEGEPIGTAQSMHECDDDICPNVAICKAKRETSTWVWTEEIDTEVTELLVQSSQDPNWR